MAALASDGDPTGVTAYNDLITLSVGLLPAQVADTEARIRHAYARAHAERVASRFLDAVRTGTGSLSQDIGALFEGLAEAEAESPSVSRSHREVATNVMQDWLGALSDPESRKTLPIPFEKLSQQLGGWAVGKLHLIGGRSSEHKTTFARACAAHLAAQQIACCYHTAEDSDLDIAGRTLADHSTALDVRALMHGTGPWGRQSIDADTLSRILAETQTSIEGPVGQHMRIIDVPNPRLSYLIGAIKVEAARGCQAYFFDFLQLIRPDGKSRPDNDWWRFCVASLAGLAKQLKIAIVCTSQIEKSGTQASSDDDRLPRADEMPFGAVLRQGAFGCIMVGTRVDGGGRVQLVVEIDKWKSAQNVRVSGRAGHVFEIDPGHDRITER
jgi:replicative DNA helicase